MGQTAANRCFRPLPLVAAIAMALVPATSHALTYTVTSDLDNNGVDPTPGAGTGTLRQAMVDAIANCVADPNPVIAFAIGTSPTFIGIGSPAVTTNNPLPALQCAGGTFSPTIDGTTQPGHVSNSDPSGYNGTHGITIFGSGLTATGVCGITFSQPNTPGGALTLRGIRVSNFNGGFNNAALCGTNMTVFGSTFDASADGVKVLAGGTAAIGNNTPADRNLIHGNSVFGVNMFNANTVNVVNSFIGTTPDGNAAQPNGIGISAQNTALIQLNGNVISGNSFEGVRLFNTQGLIIGNQIGVGSLGSVVPNQTGIRVDSTIGILDVVNNSLVHNSVYGVHVSAGTGVRLRQNSITANGTKNVTLDMYGGPVPNDFQDPDGGPNNRQNFPVVTSVLTGPSTTVNFGFNSTPGTNFDLEFYTNSGFGIPGGQTYRAVVNTTTNANGDSPLTSFSLGGAQDFISMTAINTVTGDTSEFSSIVAATGAPAVTISPPNLAFGNVPVNTTSPNMTANLLSSGTTFYQISQLSTGSCYGGPICYGGAEFTCMTDCITFNPYTPGQSCNITANFHPTAIGTQTLNIAVCDNVAGSPRFITVSGNGVPPPTLTVTPSFFDFGDVPVGGQSAAAFFRLQNPGASPVSFTSATSGPFAVVGSNCSNPIPGNGACDLDVAFLPTSAGLSSGNLVVSPSSGTPAIASLQGNGTIGPVLALPSNIDIVYTLGSPPATQRVSLQNSGQATLTFTSISISGAGFTLVNNCPASLPPGSACDLIIGFSASDRGTFPGTLTVVSNAPGGSRNITLRGLASPREVPILEVTPREIGYGRLALGSVTDGEIIKVRNIGGAPAAFDSFIIAPDFVILSNSCQGQPLGSLETCEVQLAMRPLSYGLRGGQLRINSNAENGPNFVDVFGTSCRGASLVIPRLGLSGVC